MDNLKEIIIQLSEEECKEFQAFVNRRKSVTNRKDLLLFTLMREYEFKKPAEYCKALYGFDSDANNYHSLRKRLFKHLISFIVLVRMDEDNTRASLLMGQVSLVRYLIDQGNEQLAWYYLLKSEKLAIQNEQYDLLNDIYKLQIANSENEFATPLSKIIDKKRKYKKMADKEEAASLALSLIKQRLNEVKYDGKRINFDAIITKTLTEFQLAEMPYKRPKYLYPILSITRSAILVKKDFYSFEPYALKYYQNMVKQGVFNKGNHFYKLSILYIVCHVLYRNRKFVQTMSFLEQFKMALEEHNKVYIKRFYIRYVSLLAATNSYMGNGAEAIKLIEKTLDKVNYLKETERLTLLLNLGLYYFQQGNIKKANLTEVRMGHTDYWYEKKMGREWVMKKELMALIIQYELGNDEIVTNRLQSFTRKYKMMFSNPLYKRVKLYIDLIHQIQVNPAMLTVDSFEQQIMPILVNNPEEKEDLQAMSFYSWLKSKFHKRDFYEVLLETVQLEK